MQRTLSILQKSVLFSIIFLLPIAFANIAPNPFVLPKLIILVGGVALALLVWCLSIIISGRLEYSKGTFDLPVLVIAGAYIASTLTRTSNPMEAYLLPGTTTIVVASTLLYFLINQYENKSSFVNILLFSGATFALLTLFSAFGLFTSIPQLPAYMKSGGFTPEGGYLPALLFLLPVLVVGIGNVIFNSDYKSKAIGIATSVVIGLGIIASVWNLLPGSQFSPRFPEYGTSWSIAVDAIKNSPILGVGPGNYITAFNRFKPLSFNDTDLWSAKFATASNFYLTVFTEAGLLGISGIVLSLVLLYRLTRKRVTNSEDTVDTKIYPVSAILLLVLLIVFPASLLVTVLVFILLALSSSSHKTTLQLHSQGSDGNAASKAPAILLTLPIILGIGYVLFQGARIAYAEYTFNQALVSLSQNNAQKTIENLDTAIKTNPSVDRYHMTTAQVSILLANSVAQKQDITDQDRQTIGNLIQTAIQQAKAGVALNPQRATNWELLAQVYRAIMPFAEGADQFAIQAASQAVALDPFNPNLRIVLGGIYFADGDYDNAIRAFETAVAAKRDHANSYYNIAIAYQQKGEFEKAETAMSQALSLVDKNTQDYEAARKGLEDIQAKKQANINNKTGDELSQPSEDINAIDPKIDLPEGSEPPTTDTIEPTVMLTPTQTVSVTITTAPTETPVPSITQ